MLLRRTFLRAAILTAATATTIGALPTAAQAVPGFALLSSTPSSGQIVAAAASVQLCFTTAVNPVVASDITVTKNATPVAGVNTQTSCPGGSNNGVTFTPPGTLADGDYAVSYSAQDMTVPIANTASGSFAFRVDSTAPATPSIGTETSPVTSANATAVAISGTAEASHPAAGGINADPITVLLTVHSPAGGTDVTASTTTDSSGNWSFSNLDVHALADTSALRYSVVAKDSALNSSSAATVDVLKDTTGPSATSSVPAMNGTHQSTSTVSVTFDQAVDTTATVLHVVNGVTTELAQSGSPVFTTGNTVMTVTTATPMTPAANPYTVNYTALDVWGNSHSGSFTFTIDDTPPVVTGVTVTDPINSLNQTAVTVSGTTESGAAIAVDLTDGTHHVPASGTSSSGSFSITGINASSLSDGPITASVTATDAAGNVSQQATGSATKATVAPATPTSVAITPQPVNHSNANAITVSATVAAGVTSATITIDDTSNATAPLSVSGVAPDVNHVVSHTFDVSGLVDGQLTASVTAYDTYGNPSSPGTTTATKDTGVPSAPTVAISPKPVMAGATSVTVSGTAEPAATVHLSLDDQDPATAALTQDVAADGTTGAYTASFSLTTLHDGTLTATATAQDAAGNVSAPATDTAAMDRTAPDAPVIDNTAAYANIATASAYVVGGHAEAGTAIAVTVTDGHTPTAHSVQKSTTAAGDGSWSVTVNLTSPTAFDDGVLHISVTATDAVGNVSTAGAADRQKDTVPPAAPTVTTYTHPVDTSNRTAVAVSGTDGSTEAGAGIAVSIDDSNPATSAVTTATTASGTGAYGVSGLDVSGLDDGSLTLTVTATDLAGNVGPATSLTIAKDTILLAPVSHSPSTATTKSPSTITATYDEPLDLSTTSVVVTDKTNSAAAGTKSLADGGRTVVWVPASGLTEAASPYTVTVTAHDAAGDSPAPLVFSFTVDNTPPAKPVVTTFASPINAAGASAVTVGGTAEPNSSVAVTVSNGAAHVTGSTTAAGDGTWSMPVDVSSLADGTLTATAVATDAAGNVSAVSTGVTATKDTVAPAKPSVTAFTNPVNAANATAIAVGGTADGGTSVSVDITDGTHHVTAGTTAANDGSWSLTGVDVHTLSDGVLTATAVATDAAGNPSVPSDGLASTKDTVAPAQPVITTLTDPVTAANVTSISVGGSAENGASIAIDITDGTNHVTASATAGPSGWSATGVDVHTLADGVVTATAVATDAAGNPSVASLGKSATKHTVVPSVPTSLAAVAGDTTLDISWAAPVSDGGSAVTGYQVTVTATGADTPAYHHTVSGPSVSVTGLTDDTAYTVAVAAVNAAGTGPAATVSGTPQPPPGAPAVTVTPAASSLVVSWTPPSAVPGHPVTAYDVTLAPHGSAPTATFTTQAGDVGGIVTQHTFSGLFNGQLYDVTVTATNDIGTGAAGLGSGTPRTTATAPISVSVVAGDQQLAISFEAPQDDGGSAVDDYTATLQPGNITVTSATSPITVSGLTNGQSYSISVTAHNAAGNGAAASASGMPLSAPAAPAVTSVIAGDGRATVAFSTPSNNGAAINHYTVTASPGSHAVTGASSPLVVTGLTNGTAYTFTVVAHNAVGDGAASAGVGGTPRFVTVLTLSSSRSAVTYGGTVTLSGRLTRSVGGAGLAGQHVTVYRTLDTSSARALVTLTTDSAGGWRYTYAPTANGTYSARFAGGVADAPAASRSARTTVAAVVRIAAPASSSVSAAATVLTVRGTVSPNKSGSRVALYYLNGSGRWVALASAPVSRTSAWSFRVRLGTRTWRLKVVIGATTGNAAGSSGVITVRRT